MRWYRSMIMGIAASLGIWSGITTQGHLDSVLEQVMHAWSLVNIARSITLRDAAAMNEQLFEVHLELYGRLYSGVYLSGISSTDISIINHALAGLCSSQDELCAVQDSNDSAPLQQLMKAIRTLWYKVVSKIPSNSHIP